MNNGCLSAVSLFVILVACQSSLSRGYNQAIASTFITAQGPYDQPVFITEHPGMSQRSRLSRPPQCFHIVLWCFPSFTFVVQLMISSEVSSSLVIIVQEVIQLGKGNTNIIYNKKIILEIW